MAQTDVIVTSQGIATWSIPVSVCRRALTERQVEDQSGSFDTLGGVAAKAGTTRSTVSRFFAGGQRISLPVARRIVAALGLRFEEVSRRIEDAPAALTA